MKPISPSTHLSWETIKAYLENKLSRTETHAVEEHLLDCPLCAEAIEGLHAAPRAEHEKNIGEIGKKIDRAVQDKKKKRFFIYHYRYWAVAASLILFLGLVLVLLLQKTNFEADGSPELAQKSMPTQGNKMEENKTEKNLEKSNESAILGESVASVMDNLEEKPPAVFEEQKTSKPVSADKKEIFLEKKEAVGNDVLEEKNIDLAQSKAVESPILEEKSLSIEKNSANQSLDSEGADLDLSSTKDDQRKQNGAKIIERKRAKITEIGQEKSAKIADSTAVLPEGGWEKFEEYLKNNLQYPEDAKQNKVKGTVQIEILIDKEGKIKELSIKNPLFESCDQEASRLVKNYRWLPALQKGSAIEERITVKVSFE